MLKILDLIIDIYICDGVFYIVNKHTDTVLKSTKNTLWHNLNRMYREMQPEIISYINNYDGAEDTLLPMINCTDITDFSTIPYKNNPKKPSDFAE